MRLRAEELRNRAAQAGISVEDLAGAIERTGLDGVRALRAIENWMAGRDHPRCKAADIRKLAEALRCPVPALARFTSEVRGHRGSTRKARLVTDLISGRPYAQAEQVLRFCAKRAATNVRKALMAAAADAELVGADTERLVVTESRVDEGPQIKRFRPKDRGRAHRIIKQTSHITVSLEERR